MILPGGTAYQSDAGMCGDYDSVIGMAKEVSTERFVRKVRGERLAPAMGAAPLREEWAGVAENAEAAGLLRYASEARRLIEVGEE